MKRKTIFLLITTLLFMLLLPVATAMAEGAETHYVYTAQDLLQIRDDPYGTYILCSDIDMSGVDWQPPAFYGTLDGGGHTIVNLSVSRLSEDTMLTFDGNMKRYAETRFAALFSVANDAVIKDLTLLGVNVDITSDEDCFCAMLAGYGINTLIENCTLEGRVRLYAGGTNVGVGGVVGFGDTTIRNCGVKAELLFYDRNADNAKCEMYLGGLESNGLCNMSYNDVEIDGYISTHGYVHSGGLVGMSFRMQFEYVEKTIDHNRVAGAIHFFEKNYDRRAYCEALVGEDLFHWAPRVENDESGFVRDEVFVYDTELSPEKCASPVYEDTVVEADCHHCGYTEHRCTTCGYSWKDSYVLSYHVPAEELTVLTPPGYDSQGEGALYCTRCGEQLESVILDKLVATEEIQLSGNGLALHYKQQAELNALVLPEDAADKAVQWRSSDENVALVDENGVVTAVGRGNALIICSAEDGFASAECEITVDFSAWQYIVYYVLFGWAWY